MRYPKRLSRVTSLLLGGVLAAIPLSGISAEPVRPATAASQKASPPAQRASARAARALLDKAAAVLRDKPPEVAFAAFNNQKGEFVKNDLYVFVVGLDGVMRAHGGAPEGLVGMQTTELRDAAGKPLIREMIELAKSKGSGQVDYVWLNWVSNRIENKTAFIRRVGDNVIGVGFYVPRASAEQAQTFLDRAVAEIGRVGSADAFAAFNDRRGAFVRDDLYVFVVGIDDGKFYAMGATPGLTGANVSDLRDAAGKPIVQDMIALVREKGSGEYDYVWRNPANNKVERKHSLVRKVDGFLVGVGYYTR